MDATDTRQQATRGRPVTWVVGLLALAAASVGAAIAIQITGGEPAATTAGAAPPASGDGSGGADLGMTPAQYQDRFNQHLDGLPPGGPRFEGHTRVARP